MKTEINKQCNAERTNKQAKQQMHKIKEDIHRGRNTRKNEIKTTTERQRKYTNTGTYKN